jgi:GNAT superfamily N-acetyltransferase
MATLPVEGETPMTPVVHELGPPDLPALRTHFGRLSTEDLRLRFGLALSGDRIVAYLSSIDFARDAVFGVLDNTLSIVGVAHLALSGDLAELGVSVLPALRRRGVGLALLQRAVMRARNLQKGELYMHCLAENSGAMHVARKLGMRVIVGAPEVDAYLELAPGDVFTAGQELAQQQFALIDYALRAYIDRVRRAVAPRAA